MRQGWCRSATSPAIEADGAIETGASVWSLRSDGYNLTSPPPSVIRNFTCWHQFGEGFFLYACSHLSSSTACRSSATRQWRMATTPPRASTPATTGSRTWTTMRNCDFEGVWSAIGQLSNAPGTMTIENCTFETVGAAITHETPCTGGGTGAQKATAPAGHQQLPVQSLEWSRVVRRLLVLFRGLNSPRRTPTSLSSRTRSSSSPSIRVAHDDFQVFYDAQVRELRGPAEHARS